MGDVVNNLLTLWLFVPQDKDKKVVDREVEECVRVTLVTPTPDQSVATGLLTSPFQLDSTLAK